MVGGFTSFQTYVDDLGTVNTLSDLDETGTLQFGFIVESRTHPHPETLHYEFEIRATSGDLLNNAVLASARGQFPIVYEGA